MHLALVKQRGICKCPHRAQTVVRIIIAPHYFISIKRNAEGVRNATIKVRRIRSDSKTAGVQLRKTDRSETRPKADRLLLKW